MPVVSVSRNALYARLEKNYNEEEFGNLCFEFGIELDEVVKIDEVDDDVTYKIEVGANRYDLLCLEGLARALRLFIKAQTELPIYTLVKPNVPERMVVNNSVMEVRPIIVCAILRDIKFDPINYHSFIELQDKLHQNICRKRTLVSIGTHDLDTLQGPFSYEALPPPSIKFSPLNNTTVMDGVQLMNHLEKDTHLNKYLHIIREKPTYPVIYDSNRVVLSLPPIINGNHSKITLDTTNVFIEVTAVDYTKAMIVLDTVVTMFGEYTAVPFQVEQVEIFEEATGTVRVTPDYEKRIVSSPLSYIESAIGVKIDKNKVQEYLRRMSLPSELVNTPEGPVVQVQVPPTRSDVIHACDVMEDVAIGYGFNNILDISTPPQTLTVGAQQPINKLTDQLRVSVALAGYCEVLTLSLCSISENYDFLRKENDDLAIQLSNPKTIEYQVGRTNLYVGLLKTLQHNKQVALPIKIFEISDIMIKSEGYDVGARNKRQLCAMYMNNNAGFEHIHGLLDRIMLLLEIPLAQGSTVGYWIEACDDSTYFPGRCAAVYVNGAQIGILGTLHPEVLENFELQFPVSALHLDIELL